MSTKSTRSGGKFTGSHTTVVPAAATVADIAAACDAVYKVALGYISPGIGPVNGQRRVKIGDENGSSILLSVRDGTSLQEIRVFATDRQEAKLHIARGALNAGFKISFKTQ
jgi:hypothetical protein